jgi:hypothetical protein
LLPPKIKTAKEKYGKEIWWNDRLDDDFPVPAWMGIARALPRAQNPPSAAAEQAMRRKAGKLSRPKLRSAVSRLGEYLEYWSQRNGTQGDMPCKNAYGALILARQAFSFDDRMPNPNPATEEKAVNALALFNPEDLII